jgi:tetratricopeptide (TPR) repeat protein
MTGRGIALSRLGKYEEALNNLDKVIELTDKPADAYFHRARTYALMEDKANLTRAIERTVSIRSVPLWRMTLITCSATRSSVS